MTLLILVVDDEPDVEPLFKQQFRHDLRAGRFTMEFAQDAPSALDRINDVKDVTIILILSDINMPGMRGLAKAKTARPAARRLEFWLESSMIAVYLSKAISEFRLFSRRGYISIGRIGSCADWRACLDKGRAHSDVLAGVVLR